jgi:hypothetical protein
VSPKATLAALWASLTRDAGRTAQFGVAAALVAVGLVSLPILGAMTSSQPLAALMVLGALPALWIARSQPTKWLLILSVLAWASRPTVSIAGMNMHVEQPLIAITAVVLTWRSRSSIRRLLQATWLAVVGLAIWVGAATASSLTVAPDPAPSLRVVAWLTISIVGAWVALLIANRDPSPIRLGSAFVVAALVEVVIGIWALVSGGLFRIAWGGWSAGDASGTFRAFALAWEPNIYASAIALTLPFVIHRYRLNHARLDVAIVGLLGFGLGLGLTRASWVAVAVGAIVYWGLVAVSQRRPPGFVTHTVVVTLVLVLTIAAGSIAALQARVVEGPSTAVSEAPTGGQAPAPVPVPVDLGSDTNLTFRLTRTQQAIEDFSGSPWIGLGANSFGQRHLDPTQSFKPDYLGVFPLTIVYDAGLVGFSGFLLFAVWSIRTIWRSGRPERAAFLASLAVMVPAYAATDAFRFAENWLVIGAGVGMALAARGREDPG